jgi:hypothetical protein
MRSQFDEHLRKGVNVKYQEKFISFEEDKSGVFVRTDKNAYSGKILVGADGIGGLVSILSGLNKKPKLSLQKKKKSLKKTMKAV